MVKNKFRNFVPVFLEPPLYFSSKDSYNESSIESETRLRFLSDILRISGESYFLSFYCLLFYLPICDIVSRHIKVDTHFHDWQAYKSKSLRVFFLVYLLHRYTCILV